MRKRKWFHPQVESGWKHNMPLTKRRRLVLRAHKGDTLSAARGKQALANVTRKSNPKVARAAQVDANYFFTKHRRER